MNILGIKLVTGEEIVADVTFTEDGRFKLTNSVQLRLMPPQRPGTEPSMGFAPFPALAKQGKDVTTVIEPLHIVYTYEPEDVIIDNYRAAFSGIVTPTKQIITG
jgi:hypothetical protein